MYKDLLGNTQNYNPKNEIVILGKTDEDFRSLMQSIEKNGTYQEISISFEGGRTFYSPMAMQTTKNMAELCREILGDGVEVQEYFLAVFFATNLQPVGYVKLSKGGINSTIVDTKILWAIAVKTLAVSLLVCHNHPSGNLAPSQADIDITKKLKKQSSLMDIDLLDHLIVTQRSYYSFVEQTTILRGVEEEVSPHGGEVVITAIKKALDAVTSTNSPFVYQNIQTEQGKTNMAESIIRRMIATGLTPNEIIPQIEQEYGVL